MMPRAAGGKQPYQTAAQGRADAAAIERHAPLVKRIAHHLLGRLPASVVLDDLIQAGMIGLLEAVRKYDGSRGASFETYAGIRIRGAMLDEVRRQDWAPRSVYRDMRRISQAIRQLENALGRPARDHEIAERVGMSLDDYFQVLQDNLSTRLFSFEHLLSEDVDMEDAEGGGEPYEGLSRQAMQSALAEAIRALPEREALVLSLYYDEELNLKEVGQVIGVSESRVCQIHSQAVARLRSRLREWVMQ